MSEQKLTLGQAIDKILEALQAIDEASRPTVLAAVCAHLGVPSTTAVAPNVPATIPPAFQPPPNTIQHHLPPAPLVDIRALKNQKQPRNAQQMACLVAYYLQDVVPEAERKAAVTVMDLEKFFKQAGFQLPKRLEQVLVDAKSGGYFESSRKGEYKLTAVGYNLVVHNLPSPKPA